MANLEPRGMVGWINDGDHYALLNTKYRSCGTHDFREGFCKSIEASGQCMVGKIIFRHCYILNI